MADEATQATETTTATTEGTQGAAEAAGATEAAATETTGETTATETAGAEAAQAATEAVPPKPAPAAQAVPTDRTAKLDLVKSLATELGLHFDGGSVLHNERVQFRHDIQKGRKKLDEAKKAAVEEFDAYRKQHEPDIEWARGLKAAQDSGDIEAVAKSLGHESWEAMQTHLSTVLADPRYREVQELKRKVQEREEVEERQRQAAIAAQEQQRQVQAQQQLMQRLQQQMASSGDPFVKAMARDAGMVRDIFLVQKELWDGRAPVPPEQAVDYVPPRGGPSIRQRWQNVFDTLTEAFGAKRAAEIVSQAVGANDATAAATSAETATKKKGKLAPKTGVVPHGSAAEASAPKVWKNDEEYVKYAAQRLAEAIAEEEAEEKKRRAS